MSAGNDSKPCACGCCDGVGGPAPVHLANRPGLSALAYRAGTHARFKEAMLAAVSTKPALRALTTRDDDDPAIALLDAWAVSLDVLTFYQERIANEGFLRTATERRSLLELARAIGYELRPGVAASTWLAFTLDGSPGSPREVTIAAGTRAQSLPTKSELPQSFETGEDLLARPEWNLLKPRTLKPQAFGEGSTSLFLAGVATQLRPGDALLVLWSPATSNFRILSAVEANSAEGVTRVTLEKALDQVGPGSPKIYALRQRASLFGANAPDWKGMTADFKKAYMDAAEFTYTAADSKTWAKDWPGFDKAKTVSEIDLDAAYPRIAPQSRVVLKAGQEQVFKVTQVETVSQSDFSVSARVTRLSLQPSVDLGFFKRRETAVFAESEELMPALVALDRKLEGKEIVLDRLVAGLQSGRTVIVQGKRMRAVLGFEEEAFQVQLKVTGSTEQVPLQFGESFVVLSTPARKGSSRLWHLQRRDGVEGIVKLPFTEDPKSRWFESLTLVPAEEDDPVVAEVAILEKVTSDKERTTLTLAEPLKNLFDRATVSVLANVAPATHGETRREVLGSGDAAKRFQRFKLRQKPLTYVPAPVAGGGESTLELRVNGVLWHESPDLYQLGPRDRKYVLRRDDDGGTAVRFGDGVHGARPASGVENVEAVYRTGIGLPGLVGENRIALLATRPLGVKSVTNPVPATGAADPEARDQARRNAPMTVLTLDRVVSLRDFEDFARSFSGIGKARARMLWAGGRQLVHLTVAGVDGAAVAPGSALDKNFREALDRLRDPFQSLVVETYEHLLFRVRLKVSVNPDYLRETVLAGVEAALRGAFSFEARDFGQSVFLSEVMAVAQGVAGVVYVDVDALYRDGQTPGPEPEDRLTALPARIDGAGQVLRAQILTLSPVPVAPEVIP